MATDGAHVDVVIVVVVVAVVVVVVLLTCDLYCCDSSNIGVVG